MSDVRAMLACLANEEVARVFARIVLRVTTEDVPRGKAEKAVDALTRSGLITATGDSLSLNSEGIRAELAGLRGVPTPDPLQRWFDTSGRVKQYPRRSSERRAMLKAIGDRVIADGERLSEADLNLRLERYDSDVPTLRRFLVIHGILARETDGSVYWRA